MKSTQHSQPMRRLDDLPEDEQCRLLEAMNSFLAGILAQRMMDKCAPAAPTQTLDATAVLAEAEAILL